MDSFTSFLSWLQDTDLSKLLDVPLEDFPQLSPEAMLDLIHSEPVETPQGQEQVADELTGSQHVDSLQAAPSPPANVDEPAATGGDKELNMLLAGWEPTTRFSDFQFSSMHYNSRSVEQRVASTSALPLNQHVYAPALDTPLTAQGSSNQSRQRFSWSKDVQGNFGVAQPGAATYGAGDGAFQRPYYAPQLQYPLTPASSTGSLYSHSVSPDDRLNTRAHSSHYAPQPQYPPTPASSTGSLHSHSVSPDNQLNTISGPLWEQDYFSYHYPLTPQSLPHSPYGQPFIPLDQPFPPHDRRLGPREQPIIQQSPPHTQYGQPFAPPDMPLPSPGRRLTSRVEPLTPGIPLSAPRPSAPPVNPPAELIQRVQLPPQTGPEPAPPLQMVIRFPSPGDDGEERMCLCPLGCGLMLRDGVAEGLGSHFTKAHREWWDAVSGTLECSLCPEDKRAAIQKRNYHRHFCRSHLTTKGSRPYKCYIDDCTEAYKTVGPLNEHIRDLHGAEPIRAQVHRARKEKSDAPPRPKRRRGRKVDQGDAQPGPSKPREREDDEDEDEDQPHPSKRGRHTL